MSGTRSHRPDLDDASAQSDLICAPQPITIDQTQAAQIGGDARLAIAEAGSLSVRAVPDIQVRELITVPHAL
jgi:hypothetical protein